MDTEEYEERYREMMDILSNCSSDCWAELDLSFLNELGVLTDFKESSSLLPPRFQVIVDEDKMTLVSPDFLIWLIPLEEEDGPTTYAVIGNGIESPPVLYQAVRARGVYNTSKMLMRMLGKYTQVVENLRS